MILSSKLHENNIKMLYISPNNFFCYNFLDRIIFYLLLLMYQYQIWSFVQMLNIHVLMLMDFLAYVYLFANYTWRFIYLFFLGGFWPSNLIFIILYLVFKHLWNTKSMNIKNINKHTLITPFILNNLIISLIRFS